MLAALCALSCGKRGDPLPPVRQTPQAPQLRIAQRGDQVELALIAPRMAAGGSKLPVLEIEILRATGPGDFRKLAKTRRLPAAPGETLFEKEALPPPGTLIRVAGRAWLKGRPSPQSGVVVLTVQPPPEAPRDLKARLAGDGVALEWTPPEHMPTPPSPPPSPVPSPSPAPGAVAGPPPSPPPAAGNTEPEPEDDASAEAAAPTASPAPVASPVPGASPAPKPPPRPLTGFWVYRRNQSETTYARPLQAAPRETPSYQDTTVALGDSVCYVITTVAATDPAVESVFSNEVCVTVKDVTPPAVPLGLAAVGQEAGVEISWSPSPEPDLVEYRLYRAPKGASPTLLTTIKVGTTTFADTTLEPGKVYTYTLTAVDRAGNESLPTAPAQGRRP